MNNDIAFGSPSPVSNAGSAPSPNAHTYNAGDTAFTEGSANDGGVYYASPLHCDDFGNATDVDYASGEVVADVLLELEGVRVTEIIGGKRQVMLDNHPLVVLSMMPTAEELALTNKELGLPPGTISSDSNDTGKPFVFITVGKYTLPLCPFIPVLQFDKYTFNFVVGVSFIEIVLASSHHTIASPDEDVDAFPFIVATYGNLRVHPKFSAESAAQTQRTRKRVGAISDAFVSSSACGTTDRSLVVGASNYSSPSTCPTSGAIYCTSAGDTYASTSGATGGGQLVPVSPSAAGGGGVTVNQLQKQPQQLTVYDGGYNSSAYSFPAASSGTRPLSTRIASRIQGIGRIVGSAIVLGGAAVAGGIGIGAALITAKTRPCQTPLNVPPKVKSRIEMTRKLTKGAAVISGAMATSAISVATVVGNVVGTGISEALAGDPTDAKANPKGRVALEVGSAVFTTGAVIFSSLLTAKDEVLVATGDGITKVVTHKLGQEAGSTTGNALGIGYDTIKATTFLSGGVKRKVAVAAAKTALTHQAQLQQQQQLGYHTEPAGL